MQTRQLILAPGDPPGRVAEAFGDFEPNLIVVFADVGFFDPAPLPRELALLFPGAILIGCSSGGEISSRGAEEGSAVVTGVRLEDPDLRMAVVEVADMDDSQAAGRRLASQLATAQPRAVMVIGQGVALNGSAVVRGMQSVLGPVPLFGGLAADAGKFQRTWVLAGNLVSDRHLAAVAFCSPRLEITHGAFGGWRPFGPIRKVTRARENVLFELDGEPALEVYKRYLGKHAEGLPGSALLFPFAMLDAQLRETGITRTILGIDESAGSITLAGEVLQDGHLRLLCASSEDLIGGAETAALSATTPGSGDCLALLVSCIGRRLVLGTRTDEEVEAVSAVLGTNCAMMGFYSNGEIGRSPDGPTCLLHNQSMIVAVLREAA